MIGEVDKCWDLLGGSRNVVKYDSAPDSSVFKGGKVDFGHDAEIIRAAFESFEQIGICLIVCIDDFTIGQDDL